VKYAAHKLHTNFIFAHKLTILHINFIFGRGVRKREKTKTPPLGGGGEKKPIFVAKK
jgi:hypothetical protein